MPCLVQIKQHTAMTQHHSNVSFWNPNRQIPQGVVPTLGSSGMLLRTIFHEDGISHNLSLTQFYLLVQLHFLSQTVVLAFDGSGTVKSRWSVPQSPAWCSNDSQHAPAWSFHFQSHVCICRLPKNIDNQFLATLTVPNTLIKLQRNGKLAQSNIHSSLQNTVHQVPSSDAPQQFFDLTISTCTSILILSVQLVHATVEIWIQEGLHSWASDSCFGEG